MFGVFVKCKMLFLKHIFLAPPHSTGGEAAEQSITENLSVWGDLITQVMPWAQRTAVSPAWLWPRGALKPETETRGWTEGGFYKGEWGADTGSQVQHRAQKLPKTRRAGVRLGPQVHTPSFSHWKTHSQPYSSWSLQRTELSKVGSPGWLPKIGCREASRTEAMTASCVRARHAWSRDNEGQPRRRTLPTQQQHQWEFWHYFQMRLHTQLRFSVYVKKYWILTYLKHTTIFLTLSIQFLAI